MAYLKAWLYENHGLDAESVRLVYMGKEMIDPLSLMDYPDILSTRACHVTVESK